MESLRPSPPCGQWQPARSPSAFHKSNGNGTPISARLESDKEDRGNFTILVSAGEYLHPITYPETVILERLLAHVFEEKVAHATGNNKPAAEEQPEAETATEATEDPVHLSG